MEKVKRSEKLLSIFFIIKFFYCGMIDIQVLTMYLTHTIYKCSGDERLIVKKN